MIVTKQMCHLDARCERDWNRLMYMSIERIQLGTQGSHRSGRNQPNNRPAETTAFKLCSRTRVAVRTASVSAERKSGSLRLPLSLMSLIVRWSVSSPSDPFPSAANSGWAWKVTAITAGAEGVSAFAPVVVPQSTPRSASSGWATGSEKYTAA
mmetsp:Transcript_3011/g.7232  ORF Transcript_3011/g.7232 Transcript_3011/m.7232 type:complete len:153 (+) Transcript_3011:1469-1927(+)